ncbi:MgtC/SapB family protein [Empedobacter brevis]
MNTMNFAMQLSLAFLLGAAIGLEREYRQKSAGLRTNALVSVGSAAFILMSYSIGGDATGRIASYVVSGIGFLGAGVIMKDGVSVRGLNTAATIWCSAAVGSFAGCGLSLQAVVLTSAVMFAHLLLRPVSHHIYRYSFKNKQHKNTDYLLVIKCKNDIENHLRVLLMRSIENNDHLMMKSLSSDDDLRNNSVMISAEISALFQQDSLLEKIASRLTIEKDVQKIRWEITGKED